MSKITRYLQEKTKSIIEEVRFNNTNFSNYNSLRRINLAGGFLHLHVLKKKKKTIPERYTIKPPAGHCKMKQHTS